MNLDELLAAERSRPGFSADERAAMWSGIERSIVPAATTAAAAATATATAKAAAKATAAKVAAWKVGALAAVALATGVGAGIAAHARWAAPKVVYVDRVVAPSIAAPSAPPPIATPAVDVTSLPTAPAASTAAPRASARAASPSATQAAGAPRDPGLARERTLLDMARTALARGDAASALAAADTHAREFPKSQLAEEREVIAVQALGAANRVPEAKRRAAAFHAAFPKSALGAIVDEAAQ